MNDKQTIINCAWQTKAAICLFLVLVTYGVFYRLPSYDFVSFDDDLYVTANPRVQSGLTREGIVWAFSATDIDYWHPLTWISHMLDVQLWGLDAGRHHLTNLLFHIANTLLLFLVLNQITGTLWRSAFVAALFALHPINVESVAWVAERKNVLSTFFWMLTLTAYGFYTRKPGWLRYLAMGATFGLGLLAKPMLVTLPFVLLLLDYWPLGRFSLQKIKGDWVDRVPRLILEKVPLLILSGLSVYVSSVSVQAMGSVKSLESVPMTLRFSNALVSYVKYLGKMFWPFNLAVLYPYPEKIPGGQLLLALVILVSVSVAVIWALKGHAYLAVGWFWYLGTLVPVIGLVQAGHWPAMADRWAYVPLIGLFIAIVWGIAEFASVWPHIRRSIPIAATLVMGTLSALTWLQVGYWKSSVELFQHTLEVTTDNPVAHYNIGIILTDQGKLDAALNHYAAAIRSNPRLKKAYYNQAIILAQKGYNSAAIRNFTKALRIDPDYAEAHNNLGVVLIQQGNIDEAISHFTEAVRLRSNYITAQKNLQKALNDAKRFDSVH